MIFGMEPKNPTTPPLRGTPPLQEGRTNSPPAKGEYPVRGEGVAPAKGEYPAREKAVADGARLNNLPALRTFRKALRNRLTAAEARLWTYLQRAQLEGRKFRRQHSVGGYILDFYCPSERLAVELDGAVHDSDMAQQYDRERDRFLRHCGILVLRFENRWVFQQPDAVLAEIAKHFGWQEAGG